MQRILGTLPRYVLALALWVAALSVVTHHALGTGYAGATDEAAVRAGVEAYGSFLRSILEISAALLLVEVLCLGWISSGLLLIPWFSEGGGWRWLRMLALAGVVVVAWLGSQARCHPGLFLPLVSSGRWALGWLGFSRIAWPCLLAASLAGWFLTLARDRGLRARAVGIMAAVAILLWVVSFELGTERLRPVARFALASGRLVGHPTSLAGGKASPAGRPRYPNILLIGIDSLRPDKIDRENTPALSRLLAESIYFPNTLVTLPRTAPSWAALLTSLPPLENGVETMFPTAARSRVSKIAMPAHLASLGYRTQVSSEYAGEFFGRVELGFEAVDVPRVELREMLGQGLLGRHPLAMGFAGELYAAGGPARRLLPDPMRRLIRGLASFAHPEVLGSELFDRLESLPRGDGERRPWFTLLFYSQPHFPYTSSSPYYERYLVPDSDPALRFGKDIARGEVKSDADRRQVEGLYRAALAETDAAVGRLLDRLGSSGELDDTIVILTADHGEGLYECDECVGHGDNLRGMMSLRVPLAFRLPPARYAAGAPRVVTDYVSQLDVYPTVLHLLDVPRPPIQEGAVLLGQDGAPVEPGPARTFFAETGEWLWPTTAIPKDRLRYPPITTLAALESDRIVIEERYLPVLRAAKHRTAIRPPYKLVYRPGEQGVGYGLYDIEQDPLETRDLSAARPGVFAELKEALRRSVLRFSSMIAEGDYFLTRPPAAPEEYW